LQSTDNYEAGSTVDVHRNSLPKAAKLAIVAYIVAVPICSGTTHLPLWFAAVFYVAYPLWFGIWLVTTFLALRGLARRYDETRMGTWWWLSVPYSFVVPTLSLVMGFGSWGAAHVLGLFFLIAYITVPSSVAWALVALARHRWGRKKSMENLMFAAVPLMLLLWAAVLRR
jgi:hypothetical protein